MEAISRYGVSVFRVRTLIWGLYLYLEAVSVFWRCYVFGVSILNWGLKMYELAFRHSTLLAERQPYNLSVFIEKSYFKMI